VRDERMEGTKVFELAKNIGITNKRLMEELKTIGIEPKSYMSILDDKTVILIMDKFGKGREAEVKMKFQEKASTELKEEMDSIRLSFLSKRADYEKLWLELNRLFDYVIDPRFPKEAVYTIKHRIKNMERLIEKIETHNQKNPSDQINNSNYRSKIDDLLGIRLICYRRSDKDIVNDFIKALKKENKLDYVRDPEEKEPQYKWIELDENSDEKNIKEDIQYSGYSSTHYFVKLPDSSPPNIKDLHSEIQVRTIFEDAWAELDHKYRYEYKRRGIEIPKSIDRGFRSLSAYVQAALVHAEFLCKDIDEEIKTCKSDDPASISSEKLTMEQVLKTKIRFIPTERTLLYLKRRICIDAGYSPDAMPKFLQSEVLSEFAIEEFKEIYLNIAGKEPFENSDNRDVDLINLLNYFLEKGLYGKKIAQNGLRNVIKERFPRFILIKKTHSN
jgi:ppGpp synthetase/RelA/SpoT-type nucleotidyltranferase